MKPPAWKSITDSLKHSHAALRLADFLGRGRGRLRWLDHLNAPPAALHRPDLSNWENQTLAAAWLGHATLLIRIGELTILTDPVFSNRVGIGLGLLTAGPRRHLAPALSIGDLPKIDLILLSHAHYDHLDRPTLAALDKKIPIITSLGTSDLLADLGFRQITELRWGESSGLRSLQTPALQTSTLQTPAFQSPTLQITALKVAHWGARTFFDSHRGYNAYLLESLAAPRRRIVFGGDTAFGDHFADIRQSDPIDLAILGIGGYNPYLASHATPEQAWQMTDHLRAAHLLPMHHSTFRLSHEPTAEPLERLLTISGNDTRRIVIHQIGQQWSL